MQEKVERVAAGKYHSKGASLSGVHLPKKRSKLNEVLQKKAGLKNSQRYPPQKKLVTARRGKVQTR